MVARLKKYSKIVFSSFWHDLGFGGSLFLLKIQLQKYSKIDFLSFWYDLGSGGSVFSIQHLIKRIFKIDLSGFCSHDDKIDLTNLSKMWNGGTTKEVFKNWFCQLLARSWFWCQLVSFKRLIKESIQKLFFPAFGTISVLVAACFYSNFNLKKYWKIDFSSFWHDLGFGGSLFLFKIQSKKYSKIDFLSFWHDLGSGGSFFLFNI